MISRQVSLACDQKNPALESRLGLDIAAGFANVARPACGACELAHICACGLGAIPAKLENDPLRGVSRPHNVRSGTDHDALFQGALEAVGDFGQAEILDYAKTLVAEHFRHLRRIEKTEPGLAARP